MSGILFTSREWGNFGLNIGEDEKSVLDNRDLLRKNTSLKKIVFMSQSHSDRVHVVTSDNVIVEGDAIITTEKSLGLAVLVGDCVPVLVKSDIAVAAIHAGRVGMLNGITTKTITAMKELGAKDFEVILGPSICDECYEVSPQMYEEVISSVPESATTHEVHRLNIQAGIVSQFTGLGIEVLNLGICTREYSDFYSHRRSQAYNEAEGRQVGLIYL
jgi:YfiH family protein